MAWVCFLMVMWTATSAPASAQSCPSKTGVLVYFVGLMVFEPQQHTSPPSLVAYLPSVMNHNISVQVGTRDRTGRGLKWEVPNHPSWTTDELTLELPSGSPALALKQDKLLKAKELHPQNLEQKIDPGMAALTMRFTHGTFSTCSYIIDENQHECDVLFGNTGMNKMAETMVLEICIPQTNKIKIKDGTNTLEIDPIDYSSVKDPYYGQYEKIFEIALVNVPTTSGRRLRTRHTEHLKDMFDQPKGKWSPTTAYQCNPATSLPNCFQHFAQFWPRYSGHNRPICPLIEGP